MVAQIVEALRQRFPQLLVISRASLRAPVQHRTPPLPWLRRVNGTWVDVRK
jgi:hypothetical protein